MDSGWRTIQLAANIPAEDLAQAVEFYEADLVALSVSLATQLSILEEAICSVRASERGGTVKILVGGCGLATISEMAKLCGADGFAADAAHAVRLGGAPVGLPNIET